MKILKGLNWLFRKILVKDEINLSDAGSVDDWLRFESELDDLSKGQPIPVDKLICLRWSRRVEHREVTLATLDEYYARYYVRIYLFPDFEHLVMEHFLEISRLIRDSSDVEERRMEVYLRHALLNSANILIKKERIGAVNRSLIAILSWLELDEISSFFNQNPDYLKNLDYEKLDIFSTSEIASNESFAKILKLLKHQLSSNEVQLGPLLFNLLLERALFFGSDAFEAIPFRELVSANIDDRKIRAYRDMLIIFDPNLSDEHLTLISNSLEDILANNSKSIQLILHTNVLRYSNVLEKLLLKMNSIKAGRFHYGFLNVLESMPSGLSPEIEPV
jgi:hypothetical protein